MRPSPSAIQWIKSRVSNWSQTDQQLADTLNGVQVPNPEPRKQKRPVLSAFGLFSGVAKPTQKAVAHYIHLPQLYAAVKAGDHESAANWVRVMVAGEVVTEAEATTVIQAILNPIPDPDWPAQIPQTLAALGRLLDADDIAAARKEL